MFSIMLKDKVAIITGASSGIGKTTAIALATQGCKVAIGARRTPNLEELQREIEKTGGHVFAQRLDVSDRQSCESFVNAVLKKWETVDILVNNAGLMPLSFFKNLKYEEWDQMIDVNIKGVLYCTGAVIGHMKAKKSGHIVNISSVAGRIVFPSGSVYCATKHAVTALSEGLRQEFSTRSNIRVTCIEPGVVATELTNTITDESLKDFVAKAKTMESLSSDDIANAIVYAVSSPTNVNVNEILIRPTTQER
ncbi:MAG: oxidoreductase [Cenarchaeum symbiont of Oopsacas minuta]|nr:oxidoreductase [Cenarchaeum symbiont of Oopsacas minuta]